VVAEGSADDLAELLRDAFGWQAPATVLPGPRGATARIWQVRVGERRYALKVGRGQPPPGAAVDAEVAFVDAARSAGVAVPELHADRSGRRLVPGPDGSWLRLYDWIDIHPVELDSAATPAALGELMARLHRAASPMGSEPDGSPPDPWYERPPDLEAFVPMIGPRTPSVERLSARLATLPDLVGIVRPIDPHRLFGCHRDLHPGNVLADESGRLVVLDADDVGPADPARELARALFDWWSDPAFDLDAILETVRGYRDAGGPAATLRPADFTMLVATRLNFLLGQLRVAADQSADPDDRAWAEQEIDESLRIMPTRAQIDAVVAALATS
jgi:Ser/Thr protein kinase RdoA (MazF antagonist)